MPLDQTYQLAVGLLYRNLGLVGLEFPTTSRSHPSFRVWVVKIPGIQWLDPRHRNLFPFSVSWHVWEKVAVPVLKDASLMVRLSGDQNETLRNWLNKTMLSEGGLDLLIQKIQSALFDGLKKHGYVSTDSVWQPSGPSVLEEVTPSISVGPHYTKFD